MAVDYSEFDKVLEMMGAEKDTRPLPKRKPRPKIKIKDIGTKKTSFLPHKIVDNKKKKA